MNNVTATNIEILSGATNSIHLNNVSATNLLVKDTNNKVRVVTEGTTAIENTKVESGAKLESTAGSFGEIELAPVTANQNIELVRVNENVSITKPVSVISATPVAVKISEGVEVTIKKDSTDEGIPVTGAGIDKPAATIDPTEVNRVMNLLQDDMLKNTPYPGDQGTTGNMTYTLATFVGEQVQKLTTDKNIRLSVSNEGVEYGYYKVTLTIGGATASKEIRVNALTVDNAKSFEDALGYNINSIRIGKDLRINESILIPKERTKPEGLVVDGNNKTITLESDGTFTYGGIVVQADKVEIKNLAVDVNSQETFGIQFYEVEGGKLDGVKVSNSTKGGVLVNGSEVTATNIKTDNNTWGGIEVSQGTDVSYGSNLTVQGTSMHNENVHIWTIGENSTVTDSNSQYKSGNDIRSEKVGYVNYILKSENRDVPHTVVEDTTAPVINHAEAARNEAGDIVLTVTATDENLYSLEVDHSHGNHGKWADANLPEFTIYAIADNPWGDDASRNQATLAGIEAKYDAETKTWTLTLKKSGSVMSIIDGEISNGAFELYLVANDKAGNSSGDMNGNYKEVVVKALN